MKERIFYFLSVVFIFLLTSHYGCGSGSSGGGGGGSSLGVNSLSSIPDGSGMFKATNASSSISSSIVNYAVSGTPPQLDEITSAQAPTLFWESGFIDSINSGVPITDSTRQEFWEGMDRCYSCQHVGYEVQHLKEQGVALCYMKNMPTSGAITVISGSVSDPTKVFDQETNTKLIQVTTTGLDDHSGEGEENRPTEEQILIRVYGSSSTEGQNGYAVDLAFCSNIEGNLRPGGLEQIRVNNSTGRITMTNVDRMWGTYHSSLTANLTTDASGNIIFDNSQTGVLTGYYESSSEGWKGKKELTVQGDRFLTKHWGSGTYQNQSWQDQDYMASQLSGSRAEELRLLQMASKSRFTIEGSFVDPYTSFSEYQDTRYVGVDSNDLSSLVTNFDFTADSFFSGTLAADSTLLAALNSVNCSETPDIHVTVNMDDPQNDAIEDLCEQDKDNWDEMNFCESSTIRQARQAVEQSYVQ